MQVKQCNRCGVEKPSTEFHRHPRSKDRLACICKPCACEVARLSRLANPEKRREYERQYRLANPGKNNRSRQAWRQANPGKAQAERIRNTPHMARYHARLRAAVFDHYGRSCACCGATENLAIDHVNGDGPQHRAAAGIKTGTRTYRWLVKNNFPDGFQTLCTPCNASKGAGASCNLNHRGAR